MSRAASVSAGLAIRPIGAPPTAFAIAVLDAVDTIPAGRVMTYGDVAEYVGFPRRHRAVGQVLSTRGREVPWWRVILASGHPNPAAPVEGLARLAEEGCPLRGDRVDLSRARWDGRAGWPPSAPGVAQCADSWFGRPSQGGRRKREPGATPGLPRSGEQERPPS